MGNKPPVIIYVPETFIDFCAELGGPEGACVTSERGEPGDLAYVRILDITEEEARAALREKYGLGAGIVSTIEDACVEDLEVVLVLCAAEAKRQEALKAREGE